MIPLLSTTHAMLICWADELPISVKEMLVSARADIVDPLVNRKASASDFTLNLPSSPHAELRACALYYCAANYDSRERARMARRYGEWRREALAPEARKPPTIRVIILSRIGLIDI
jgi:hypothetical protein